MQIDPDKTKQKSKQKSTNKQTKNKQASKQTNKKTKTEHSTVLDSFYVDFGWYDAADCGQFSVDR